jgi:hypothetical protein
VDDRVGRSTAVDFDRDIRYRRVMVCKLHSCRRDCGACLALVACGNVRFFDDGSRCAALRCVVAEMSPQANIRRSSGKNQRRGFRRSFNP